MQALAQRKEKLRKNFYLSADLLERAEKVANERALNLSLIVSEALAHYLESLEKQKIELALEEGYKANETYYLRMSKEWEAADAD